MALSQAARDFRNKRRRERYASDPAFREKEKKRIEAYWERKAAEATVLDADREAIPDAGPDTGLDANLDDEDGRKEGAEV